MPYAYSIAPAVEGVNRRGAYGVNAVATRSPTGKAHLSDGASSLLEVLAVLAFGIGLILQACVG